MEVAQGHLYFITDAFFAMANDPFLKLEHSTGKRPHYFAWNDPETGLFWMVPCSSKIEKFENILRQKALRHKPADGLMIVKIQDNKTALLFQDMFPVTEHYISGSYVRGGQVVRIADPKLLAELEKRAKKVVALLRHGVRFTPTQPDALRIESLMLGDLQGGQ